MRFIFAYYTIYGLAPGGLGLCLVFSNFVKPCNYWLIHLEDGRRHGTSIRTASDTGSHRCRWSQRCARLLALADFLGAVWVLVVGADVPLYTKYPGLTSSSQDGCSPGKRQDTHPESTRYHTRTKRHDVNGNENETSTHIPPECGLRG